jgi:hypothetical protein
LPLFLIIIGAPEDPIEVIEQCSIFLIITSLLQSNILPYEKEKIS